MQLFTCFNSPPYIIKEDNIRVIFLVSLNLSSAFEPCEVFILVRYLFFLCLTVVFASFNYFVFTNLLILFFKILLVISFVLFDADIPF